MAGFWTGLVHGALISGAALVALSLAMPLDARSRDSGVASAPAARGTGVPTASGTGARLPAAELTDDAQSDASAVPATAAAATPDGGAPPAVAGQVGKVGSAGPAERLPDPVGSDFRRGSDDPPSVPRSSPTQVSRHVPRNVDASREGAPPPAPASVEAPPVGDAPAAPALRDPEDDKAGPPAMPAQDRLVTRGRAAVPGLDRLPERGGPDAGEEVAARPGATQGRDAASGPSQAAAMPATESVMARPEPAAPTPDLSRQDDRSDVQDPPRPDGRQKADDPSVQGPVPSADPTGTESIAAGRTADGDGAAAAAGPSRLADRAPRPAPELSIPRVMLAPSAGRAAPGLPQPAAATPSAPDLSDINPGALR